ncbi:MAG: hypothetical protein Q4D38_06820 [Planctomycetia bacterium]|nr:hypothetical protein [Planctomycetia bacterium]
MKIERSVPHDHALFAGEFEPPSSPIRVRIFHLRDNNAGECCGRGLDNKPLPARMKLLNVRLLDRYAQSLRSESNEVARRSKTQE